MQERDQNGEKTHVPLGTMQIAQNQARLTLATQPTVTRLPGCQACRAKKPTFERQRDAPCEPSRLGDPIPRAEAGKGRGEEEEEEEAPRRTHPTSAGRQTDDTRSRVLCKAQCWSERDEGEFVLPD